ATRFLNVRVLEDLEVDQTATLNALSVQTGPVTLPAASIPDSALSSNVPLKDAVNVFLDRATFTGGTSGVAGASVVIRSASPGITIVEEDAGEDEKAWSLGRPANGRMFFSTQTDDLIGGAIPA